MEARQKTVLALSLGVLWAGLAAWQWGFMEEPVRVPLTNVTGLAPSDRHEAARGTSRRVDLRLLASADVQREASFTEPRNIFAVPRPDGSLPLGQEPALANQEGLIVDETSAEQAAEMEPAQYRYLGFLRMGESRQKNKNLALLSKGDEVMVLKVGDHVDGRLILRAITAESVIMRDTDTRMEKTVLLSEETVEQE